MQSKSGCLPIAAIILTQVCGSPATADEGAAAAFFEIVSNGKSQAMLVAPDDPAAIWNDAIAAITSTAVRWSGAPPRLLRLAKDAPLPRGNLILLGTPQSSAAIAELTRRTDSPIARVPFSDGHGF